MISAALGRPWFTTPAGLPAVLRPGRLFLLSPILANAGSGNRAHAPGQPVRWLISGSRSTTSDEHTQFRAMLSHSGPCTAAPARQGFYLSGVTNRSIWEVYVNSNWYASFRGLARLTMAGMTLIALLCGLAFAQETTGGIQGQVTDPSGAAVVGAKVEISGGALPRAIELSTDSTGAYQLPQVPVGMYTITVSMAGFSTVKKTDTPVIMVSLPVWTSSSKSVR